MFGLNILRAAIARLAGSLNSLADTADEVRANVRQQLALDAPSVEIAALPDATAAGMPSGASRIVQDEPSPENGPMPTSTPPASSRNGRRKTVGSAAE